MKRYLETAAGAKVLIYLILAVSAGCAADASEMDNADFRLWCGDHPCAWRIDEGEVEQIPTWHDQATGIGLVSDPTVISQVVDLKEEISCITLSLLADLPEGVTLYFEVDFFNDGMDDADPSIEIKDAAWRTIYQEVAPPSGCDTARIIFRKTGAGTASIARAALFGNSYCAANPAPYDGG